MADTVAIKIKAGFGNVQIGIGSKNYASVAGTIRVDPADEKPVIDHLRVIGAIDETAEPASAEEVSSGTQ